MTQQDNSDNFNEFIKKNQQKRNASSPNNNNNDDQSLDAAIKEGYKLLDEDEKFNEKLNEKLKLGAEAIKSMVKDDAQVKELASLMKECTDCDKSKCGTGKCDKGADCCSKKKTASIVPITPFLKAVPNDKNPYIQARNVILMKWLKDSRTAWKAKGIQSMEEGKIPKDSHYEEFCKMIVELGDSF